MDRAQEADRPTTANVLGSNIPSADVVTLYFQDMKQFPLLTPEEEVALAKKVERGLEAKEKLSQEKDLPTAEQTRLQHLIEEGDAARQRLIVSNTRLVVSIAKKYRNYGMPFLDLIQAGNEGLIKAVDRFDYRKGNKFSSYAFWWIRQAVFKALNQHGRLIRLPVHINKRVRKLHRTAQTMEKQLGRRPTPPEIAAEMDIKPQRVRQLLKFSQQPLSLNAPAGESGESELGSFIVDTESPSPSDRVERRMLRQELKALLKTLSPKEATVLCLRYGLQGQEVHTLKELGRELQVSRERVRQIERKALRKLRHPQNRKKLYSYLS